MNGSEPGLGYLPSGFTIHDSPSGLVIGELGRHGQVARVSPTFFLTLEIQGRGGLRERDNAERAEG